MAVVGTQTSKHELGDNVHIALLPNTLHPAPVQAPSTGGGVSIYTR